MPTDVRDRYRRYPAACHHTGEQAMQCPVTGDVYRVTACVETPAGGRIALDKEPL